MKLKRGKRTPVYVEDINSDPIERDAMLEMVQGKTLNESKEIVSKHEKQFKTEWLNKRGEVEATSYCDSVISIEIKPSNAKERQKELLDELKAGLEAISSDDCDLDDVRKALKAQIAYSEFMDEIN